ncbi:hypothetical protein [Streptomyces cacaoi]|uniref:hypothetical protein n=1 Tax=Streptomyces cacaoi TaxID=1898 RepID=UPI00130281A9|nr:hypothetical protein [Streptomyces cacaoi]NNG84819.1 hypothetical protein [Streptomyces cacaoi]
MPASASVGGVHQRRSSAVVSPVGAAPASAEGSPTPAEGPHAGVGRPGQRHHRTTASAAPGTHDHEHDHEHEYDHDHDHDHDHEHEYDHPHTAPRAHGSHPSRRREQHGRKGTER